MNQINFFQSLLPLLAGLDALQIAIAEKDGKLIVSVLPKASGVKDKAAAMITPLILTGTAEEMDQNFISTIQHPVEKVSGFYSTIKNFEQSMEEARKKSDMEKQKKEEERKAIEKEKKLVEENDKKAKEILAEVEAELKSSPVTAFNKLEEYSRKGKKHSKRVTESIETTMAEIKKLLPQASLFA